MPDNWKKLLHKAEKAAVLNSPVTNVSLEETWSSLRFRRVSEIKVMTRKSIVPGIDR
ncbi:hypothetical protein [Paenibacillus alkalitolerans]|uniref:hypothetical protein n=1 Tax=Paenibacillus alkalitolerans TaxID=2799335 RepID=UPI0018F35B95|nr:hypothetical protein [Paenibacillus alkalitolerans]